MKTKISIFGGILVGIFFMYLAFRNIDAKNLVSIYSETNAWYLVPFSFLMILEVFARGVRWKLLLNPTRKIRIWDTFRFEAIGLALNNILPLRLGEIVRGVLASKKFDISLMTVFSTILVERAMDTLTLFIFFMLALKFDGFVGIGVDMNLYFWLALFVLVSFMLVLIFIEELILHHKLSKLFNKFPRFMSVLKRIALGAKGFHNLKTAGMIIGCGFVQWFINILNFYIIAKAFNIDGIVNMFKSMKLVFAGAIAASVPGMPGYFGNYEFSISKVMSLWGISRDIGFAYASYLHVFGYIVITVVGIFFMYQMGHSIANLYKQFKHGKPQKN